MKRTAVYLLLAAAAMGAVWQIAGATDSSDRFNRKLHTLNSIVKELQTGYVDTLAVDEIMDGAINMLLYQIDPYTEYYPADNQDELMALSEGSYAGIGSIISKRGDKTLIAYPYWNSPARRGGLRFGDVIVAVDGDTVTAATEIGSVSKRLRGQAGTKVRVDVARPYVGADSLLSFEIMREDIPTEAVPYYGVLADSIGFIRLNTFSESAGRDVRRAVGEIVSFPGLKGMILDLRDNGGGLVEGAVSIAGLFVPRGTEILRTRGRGEQERIFKTTQNPLAPNVPLVILVNGQTASASEIVAGSLQDLDRAVIMGTRTFGKGLVQSSRPLPYDEILKLTTARYYIPSGRLIQALNYAERNEDGTPTRIPDSLTTVFSTRAGRMVRDGGGITPDTTVEARQMSRLTAMLSDEACLFDFANSIYAAHPQAPSEDAELADSAVFDKFKDFVAQSGFNYGRTTDRVMQLLRDVTREEGYPEELTDSLITNIKQALHRDLDTELDRYRTEITNFLDTEIGTRYFPDSVVIRRSLDTDTIVTSARQLLHDAAAYRAILTPRAQR